MEGARAPSTKDKKIMRQSLLDFIEICYEVRTHLALNSYELHDYSGGAFADFKTTKVADLYDLVIKTKGYETRIFADGDYIIIRVYEDYKV